jgi:hypothetical protein
MIVGMINNIMMKKVIHHIFCNCVKQNGGYGRGERCSNFFF